MGEVKVWNIDANFSVYAESDQQAWRRLVDFLHADGMPTDPEIILNNVWDAEEDQEWSDLLAEGEEWPFAGPLARTSHADIDARG